MHHKPVCQLFCYFQDQGHNMRSYKYNEYMIVSTMSSAMPFGDSFAIKLMFDGTSS